jgi:uncharacterized protein (DUF362 family)
MDTRFDLDVGERGEPLADSSPGKAIARRDFLKLMGAAAFGALSAGCQSNPPSPTLIPSLPPIYLPTASPSSTPIPTASLSPTPVPTASPSFTPIPTASLSPTLIPTARPLPTRTPAVTRSLRPRVAIAQAARYERKLVRQQMQIMLDNLGGVSDIIRRGARVAIKVNLTGGTDPQPLPKVSAIESYVTHPEVVRALGELLRDAGASQLYIVEAVYDARSYPEWGYTEAAQSFGASLVDLNDPAPYKGFTSVPVGKNRFLYESFTFNPILQEIDAFVSVAKIKCHWNCGVTHSMKNLIGLVPMVKYRLESGDTNRSAFHGKGDEFRARLPKVILDLNRARPIHLAVLDGVKTVEGGEGPWHNIAPVEPGVLIAGKNALAADSVATAVMGFDPTAEYPNPPFLHGNNHLNLARELGLGVNRVEGIEVVGASIKDVLHPFAPSRE